jgi:hypothetical protein
MDQHERVHPALRNEPGGNDGFSERGRSGQDAGVVGQHRIHGDLLLRPERPAECGAQRRPPRKSFIPHDRPHVQALEQLPQFVKTSSR